jgi:8-oxo-dGTP diphosphatase
MAASRGFSYAYPRPAVTVDVLIIRVTVDGVPSVLLIQRKHSPFKGSWALPGGFVDEHEDLDAAAARELEEETHVSGQVLAQFGAFGAPGRDPRGHVSVATAKPSRATCRPQTVTVAYASLVAGSVEARADDDAAAAKWWPLSDALPPVAFDHSVVCGAGLEFVGRVLLQRGSAGAHPMSEAFASHAGDNCSGLGELLLEAARRLQEAQPWKATPASTALKDDSTMEEQEWDGE